MEIYNDKHKYAKNINSFRVIKTTKLQLGLETKKKIATTLFILLPNY